VGVPDLDQAAAMRWIGRWDGQQNGWMPDREERFTALIDAVEAEAGRPDPLVLDLGSGPGSLAVRLLNRMPSATVIAIDADPLLLALGRAAHPALAGLRFTDLDLRSPGWASRLGLTRPADAAVSTTALHWLTPPELCAMYAELATVLRPGGLLLDGDHLTEDAAVAPTLARLDQALTRRIAERGTGRPGRRAAAPAAERGPPWIRVGAAGAARQRADRGRVRRDRGHLAARREPDSRRRPGPLTRLGDVCPP
jgi:SAM-dependent methyltransferase